jgi:hypothetical protein
VTGIFGSVIDSGRVEQAVSATLEAWLPSHLHNQETENGLPTGKIPRPRSWPPVSEFDPRPHEQLPSVVIVSPGTTAVGPREAKGKHRATWRVEIAVCVAGRDEPQARKLAAMYIAAVRSALVQNPTLGGFAERTDWAGEDNTVGAVDRQPRAIYGAYFDVTVEAVVDHRAGPATPPDDPYDPPDAPQTFTSADITVTSEP